MEKPPKNVEEAEVSGGDTENKNWRGILIALLVIIVICLLVAIAIFFVTPKRTEENIGEPFTLEDVFTYSVNKFVATWKGERNVFVYHSDADGCVYEFDVDLNETRLILESSVFTTLNVHHYTVSDDLNYILIAHDADPRLLLDKSFADKLKQTFRPEGCCDTRSEVKLKISTCRFRGVTHTINSVVYKHSYKARYSIYNRHSPDHNKRLVPFPQSEEMTEKLQFAAWAPRDHALTFVYGNNLYYQANPFTTPVRVADNRGSEYVLNGIADWLYEEEILHDSRAHWLSADSRYIAYLQFNDTNVPQEMFPVYNEPTDVYGAVDKVSYPKAGDPRPGINPTVKLYIAETTNVKSSHRVIAPPRHLQDKDHYITMVRWRDNSHVLVAWSNRAQNRTLVTLCHVVSTDCQENIDERQPEGRGWVSIEDVKFVRKGQQYLTILPSHVPDEGYWKHIALITSSMDHEGARTFVTRGPWDVMSIVGVTEDFTEGYAKEVITVYFISTDGNPRKRHLFSVRIVESGQNRRTRVEKPVCITCERGPDCQYVNAVFSGTGKYFVEECLGPGVPTYVLRSSPDESNNSTSVQVLEDNAELKKKLSKKALPKKEYFEFTTADGEVLSGQVYLPPLLNKEHITLYPLLIHTYAGPDTQQVTEEFKLDWSTYLTSSENVIYASIDGRGSSGRGTRFMHSVHRRLGTVEVQDQIAGASFLKKLQFVDKERIAIWGWSYGGFVVTHVLGDKDDASVRCGIAVAPVTDWRYYDTAYTERYMGFATSNDNYKAYDNANVSSKAKYFRGKGFLLIHGTADDNVHFQNSAQLMKALTMEGVMYQTQVYPDKNHNLAGPATTRHHYSTMTRFLQKECWGGGKPHEAKPIVVEMTQKQQKVKP